MTLLCHHLLVSAVMNQQQLQILVHLLELACKQREKQEYQLYTDLWTSKLICNKNNVIMLKGMIMRYVQMCFSKKSRKFRNQGISLRQWKVPFILMLTFLNMEKLFKFEVISFGYLWQCICELICLYNYLSVCQNIITNIIATK